MYTESSAPAVNHDKASLTSSIFPSVHSRCMTFFYSMNGPAIGALRAFLVNAETGSEVKIWEKVGHQDEGWKEGEVDISSQQPYKVWSKKEIFVFWPS